MNETIALGMMSGTSLDGLDLALCKFQKMANVWSFEFLATDTVSYSSELSEKLKKAHQLSAEEFLLFHNEYGHFLGKQANSFIQKHDINPQIIASHGHTIFHQPEKKFSFQIGNSAEIAALTGITTVADFRTLDVALAGQGAPLVPIGDQLLFSEYDICLNLGGFANLSVERRGKRIAFDISAFNFVLNYLAQKKGFTFDDQGNMGKKGSINLELIEELNQLDFYQLAAPKSLAREWVETVVFPIIDKYEDSVENKLCSYYEHLRFQFANLLNPMFFYGKRKLLITGGGAYNQYFIDLLKITLAAQIYIPDRQLIDFKEALIFAFLGVLRYRREINTLKSVTGAISDSSGGIIYLS